ncbi:hypothetical protein GQ53DRAFT_786114 [Thozetella sp. PMI_491]|nr:hypothetical protein GQ53DRAFT_786114 [Thozetella sp. PMI_491]
MQVPEGLRKLELISHAAKLVIGNRLCEAAHPTQSSTGWQHVLRITSRYIPSRDDAPPATINRDDVVNAYLPASIGGVVGSYALSLVLVATLLLALAKKRREHLRNGEEPDGYKEPAFNPFPAPFLLQSEEEYKQLVGAFPYPVDGPTSPALKNFSHPLTSPRSPLKTHLLPAQVSPQFPSPTSTISHPATGVDLRVDQSIVARDREMAQQQLEDMYKFVMEQEDAKEAGREYEGPSYPTTPQLGGPVTPTTPGTLRKNKPSNLNLSKEEKTTSIGSSVLSFLKSPRGRKMKGVSISSPIMTPMSGTFPRQEFQEMNSIPHREYAPPPPPPVPTDTLPFRRQQGAKQLPTPEVSPTQNLSIDERLDAAIGRPPTRDEKKGRRDGRDRRPSQSHSRDPSSHTAGDDGTDSDTEPLTATSNKSTSNLVGLPTSPKPGVNRFPSLSDLPKSPAPGHSFPRFNAPNAVRTGGGLPLRAYEPSLKSPSQVSQTTKQTVFTRAGPMSPGAGGLRTPWTGAPVPYTPYQPFSPVVPITPSLVTRADRKRMRRLEPKTPTVEMVKDQDDVW